MGQGTHTTMALIAAEVLGISANAVRVIAGDTDTTPVDVGAFAQRGTIQTGSATKKAAEEAREQLASNAAEMLEVDVADLEFKNGEIVVRDDPEKSVPFSKVAFSTLHSKEGRFVMGRGFHTTPVEFGTAAWSFGAQVAEVEVDPDTGMVDVKHVWVAHDCGKAINPLAIEGQIDGQVYSAMSQVLYEEVELDDGQFLNPSRLEYKMPRTYEMPEVDYYIVESNDPYGPFGAKEVGGGTDRGRGWRHCCGCAGRRRYLPAGNSDDAI